MDEKNLTVGQLAKTADVNVKTVRYYHRIGLLPAPERACGSTRRCGESDVTRVRFVKSAQGLGFSLDEIAELLRLEMATKKRGHAALFLSKGCASSA